MNLKVIGGIAAVAAVTAGIVVPLEVMSGPSPMVTVTSAPTPGRFINPPSTGGNLNCGADQSSAFSNYLNGLPANSTVTLPAGACYTISSSIQIENVSGLTINGNGATFNQWPPSCGFANSTQTATAVDNVADTVTIPTPNALCVGDSASGAGLGGAAKITAIVGNVVSLSHVTGTLTTSAYTFTNTDTLQPIIFALLSSGITINDVNLVGAWDGFAGTGGPCNCRHGQNVEGAVGAQIQAVTGFTMRNSSIIGTQGDCFAAQIPTTPPAAGTNILNTNVNFSFNTEFDCGYTGASIESVSGMTFSNNTVTNVQENAVSFEVDGASTFFASQTAPPAFAAIDDLTMTKNTFHNWNVLLIAAENGGIACTSTPCSPSCPGNGSPFQTQSTGVCTYYSISQRNFAFTNNTLECDGSYNPCALTDMIGTNATLPPPAGQTRALDNGVTFSNNTMTVGQTGAVSGGSGCTPDSGSINFFHNILNIVEKNNKIPIVTATTGTGCGGAAYLSANEMHQIFGASQVSGNTFIGGSSSNSSASGADSALVVCANIYGNHGQLMDPACGGPPMASYNSVVLADNPVAFWNMSNPSGSESDLTGNSNTGTYHNSSGITTTTLPNGDTAVDFAGNSSTVNSSTGEYMSVPSNSTFSIPTTGALTWEAWIKADSTLNFPNLTSNYMDFLGKCQVYSPTCEWEGRWYPSPEPVQQRCARISAYVFNPTAGLGSAADWQPNQTTGGGTCSQTVLSAGTWYYVVGEYQTSTTPSSCTSSGPQPGTINIWVNGVQQDFAAHTPTGCMSQHNIVPTANNSPFDVGTLALDSFFSGAVGKVAIYDSLLSQTQINNHYMTMTGVAPSGSCSATCTIP